MKKKDGEKFIAHASLTAVKDSKGVITSYRGIVRDITYRKRAEEQVKQSEQKFRTIFDEATDGILLADIEGKVFLDGNKAICAMLGYSLEEIQSLGIRDIHPAEGLPYVMEQFEKQLKREISLAKDMPVKRKDGGVFYADVSSTPIVLDGKSFMMGVFRDITDRKRAEEAIRNEAAITGALLEAADVASRDLVWGDVVSNVAGLVHELTASKGVFVFQLVSDGILLPQYAVGFSSDALRHFNALRVRVEDISCFMDALTQKMTLITKKDELQDFGLADYSGPLGLLDLVVVPITTREHVVGFICVNFDTLPSDARVVTIIEGIARQLGVAYDNSRLYLETREQKHRA